MYLIMICLILLTYFIVGILCNLVFYAYKCYEYKHTKQTYTWEYWSEHEDFEMMFIMFLFLWPIMLFWYISYGIYAVITKKIRNYFGIK